MSSILDILNRPLTEDMLNNNPQDIYASLGADEGPMFPTEDPRTISRQIQEALGSKQPNQAGLPGEILAQRLRPSLDNIAKGALSTLTSGKPISGQDVADQELSGYLERLSAVHKLQSGDAPSDVQTYQYYKGLPEGEKDEFLRVKRAQQMLNLGGSQVVLDPRGGVREQYQVTPEPEQMPGFRANVAGAEANARNLSDINSAAEIERQKKIGSGDITDVQKKESGQKSLSTILGTIRRDYNQLDQLGAIVSTKRKPEENALIKARSSNAGQALGRTFGTGEQVVRENIKSTIPLLMSAIKSATGKSAQEVNSIPEMQLLQASVTNLDMPLESVINQLDNLQNLYGLQSAESSKEINWEDLP